jgi:hypothetical protein
LIIFGFLQKKSEPAINRSRTLAAIPVINPGLQISRDPNGNAVIRMKVRRGSGWFARFQPPIMVKTIKLDELGTFVLDQVNGEDSVLDILSRFAVHFRSNRREAELSTVEFFKSLMKKGVVSMVVK